jgi:hypothetical protein
MRFLFANRGVVFNAVFFIYIFTLQWPLLNAVARVMEQGQTAPLLGLVLIVVTFAELVGIHLKLPVLNHRIGKRKIKHFWLFFIIWVFHIVVNMMLVLFGMSAFGLSPSSERLAWIPIGFAFFVVIKELYLLFYFAFKPRIKNLAEPHKLALRELCGDALIFVWSAVAFTVTWVYAAVQTPILRGNIVYVIAQLAGAAFLFLMMFLPLRLLQFYEDWSLPRTRGQKLWGWLTLLANVTAAMGVMVFNIPRW